MPLERFFAQNNFLSGEFKRVRKYIRNISIIIVKVKQKKPQ
jgi:hypothetical protein